MEIKKKILVQVDDIVNDYRIEVDGEIFNIEHEICKLL